MVGSSGEIAGHSGRTEREENESATHGQIRTTIALQQGQRRVMHST
jgi:hypothetical protein